MMIWCMKWNGHVRFVYIIASHLFPFVDFGTIWLGASGQVLTIVCETELVGREINGDNMCRGIGNVISTWLDGSQYNGEVG